MRVYITGSRSFGSAVLELCERLGHDVAGACSPPTTADGRTDRLCAAAAASGVPWRPADSLRADTLPAGVDLILAAHSHAYVGRVTRSAARLGAIGYHPSLLPVHRGRDAIEWTIRMRDRVAGGTVYWLSDSLDAGDIAAQAHAHVRPDDSAADLWRRELFPLGLLLFERVLADVAEGRLVRIPQDEASATWEPSIGRPPVFRPELPQLGNVPGFEVVRSKRGRL